MASTALKPDMPHELPADWDGWLASQGSLAGFCQTSMWAAIHLAVNRATSYAVSVDRDGARVAGALVSLRPAGLTTMNMMGRLRSRVGGSASGTLECFEGPVLPEGNVQNVLADVLSQVNALAKRLGVNHIRFAGAPVLAPWAGSEDASRIFQEFGYRETPWLTSVVDLAPDEDTLRRNLKQAARKGIRKSQEAGLSVKLCESQDEFFGTFCKAYYEDANGGDQSSIASRNRAFWQADSGRSYRFFVVEDPGGNFHAALGTYSYNGVATEILSGRTAFGKASNLPAQDLLHWEAMLSHKREGDRHFNLAGYSPDPINEKEVGIRRFKEKWGGREIAVPAFVRLHEPGYVRVGRSLKAKVSP